MAFWSKLFGGGKADAAAPKGDVAAEDYKGFRIVPEPMKDGGQFRIAARIEKAVGGEVRVHKLIRADTMAGYDQAVAASVAKARQMIDEQGERMFR